MRCKTRNQTYFFMLCKTQIRLILFCGLWCKTQASCQLKINLYGVTQARIVLLCAVQLKLDSFLYSLNNSTQTHHMYMSLTHPCCIFIVTTIASSHPSFLFLPKSQQLHSLIFF